MYFEGFFKKLLASLEKNAAMIIINKKLVDITFTKYRKRAMSSNTADYSFTGLLYHFINNDKRVPIYPYVQP